MGLDRIAATQNAEACRHGRWKAADVLAILFPFGLKTPANGIFQLLVSSRLRFLKGVK
jgi:hypothetical protein